ncbi:AAA family ATPase [Rhizobium leguminosarum]|uniref:AAA family ATPase n=1 Tax=Rhizobium ruizarguesonis TaxID=2081791 RepID=UPI0013B5E8FA|nr:AAA family ATPase [Rhizobium ruizarguesonis]NEI14603.1 AAA family ATPase [Rhizobium ruizarguesonis]
MKSITIEGFRAFGRQATIDLDADVILLHGPNGVGKTSLLDAILWALAGTIARFAERGTPISTYAREGRARVELTISGNDGDVVLIRATDGTTDDFLRLRINDREYEQAAATQQLCNLLLPHLKDRVGARDVLNQVLTRGVYLQQDLVRQFIDDDSAADRFALISEVIGAGAVLELQTALEKSRRSWAASTTTFRKEELDPLVARVAQVDEHLARLSDGGTVASDDARETSNALFQRAVALLGESRFGPDGTPTTPARLDRFLKTLDAERSRLERDLATTRNLLEQIPELFTLVASNDTGDKLRQEEINLVGQLSAADEALRTEHARLSAERQAQVAAADRAQRAATMAKLALQDLGEHCPVCRQTHDVGQTIAHLQALIEVASDVGQTTATDRLGPLTNERADIQASLNRVREELRREENDLREREARRSILMARVADLGIGGTGDAATVLRERANAIEKLLGSLAELLSDGERLSLQVLRLGEQRQRDELMAERVQVTARLDAANSRVASEEATRVLSGQIIDALRDASLAVTAEQITKIAPLFQRIYSRIDPHPTFRVTQIVAGMERGRGKLEVGIHDPDAFARARDAGPLLSSSQMNSFAVSLFLAMNLALPSLRLGVTILDDPLQSLDSINLLGLVDVLRRFRAHRQIIVSTHEERLVGLLQRKLRPVLPGERMVTMIFENWSREGPAIRTVEFTPKPDENVIAA